MASSTSQIADRAGGRLNGCEKRQAAIGSKKSRPRFQQVAQSGRAKRPSAVSGKNGLCATSQAWSSGAAEYLLYPPQNTFSAGLSRRAPALTAFSMVVSTSVSLAQFQATALPRNASGRGAAGSSASCANKSQENSDSTTPPASKKATS